MSKNSNHSSNGRNDFPVFAGILLGIVMGLALAGGIAWFILKKNPVPTPAIKEAPQVTITPAKPGTNNAGDSKARFEFYKELTGKPDPADKKPERLPPVANKPTPVDKAGTYFLQEGAYTSMDDAEKVKAKLALLGMVANVQPANIPDKGLWYRVRLGPYNNATEMNEALATLKLNGLNAAPIKAH